MALQIWLPLNGNLNNQGLKQLSLMTNTSATFSHSGKIGQYSESGRFEFYADDLADLFNAGYFSISFWGRLLAIPTESSAALTYLFQFGNAGNNTQLHFAVRTTSGALAFCFYGDDYTFKNNSSDYIGVWHHFTCTYDGEYQRAYVDGVLIGSRATTNGLNIINTAHFIVLNSMFDLNDFRIYDHVLSPREVAEIAKGLVLHYPLNNDGVGNKNLLSSIDTSFLSYSNGACTIFTNQMNGGTQEIVSNITGATKCVHMHSLGSGNRQYITIPCYAGKSYTVSADYYSPTSQSTAFRGELHGGEYSWAESNSGAYTTPNQWERKSFSYTALVNDATIYIFVYCANGSDCYVKNIKVEEGLIATPYIPAFNDATYGVGTVIHDTSGFGNNGTIVGELKLASESPRYSGCTYIKNTSNITHPRCLDNTDQEWTCCAWVKLDASTQYQPMNNFNNNNHIVYDTTPLLYLNGGDNDYYMYGSEVVPAGTWTHIAFVFKNSTGLRNVYINGVLKNRSGPNKTSTPLGIPNTVILFNNSFSGYVSDYREYATALTADQVKQLYEAPISLANNGTLFANEFNET